jgi:hypothetical protein
VLDAYYISKALAYIERLPKEVIYAATAYGVAHKLIDATTNVKVEQLRFETERLKLEIEIMKQKRVSE